MIELGFFCNTISVEREISVDFSVYQSASTVASHYGRMTAEEVAPELTGQAFQLALLLYKAQNDVAANREQLMAELGDLLYWCARVADVISCDMNDVARLSVRKVASPVNRLEPKTQFANNLMS